MAIAVESGARAGRIELSDAKHTIILDFIRLYIAWFNNYKNEVNPSCVISS
jgi:hypothetical protein